jgi:hypothetical protein
MVAAFMTYIVHCEVFPEPDLSQRFARATDLARSASRGLLAAKELEGALTNLRGWNRASWSAFGGAYGQAERGGMEKEVQAWDTGADTFKPEKDDDGGWIVEQGNTHRLYRD